jgi:hypothetical protein
VKNNFNYFLAIQDLNPNRHQSIPIHETKFQIPATNRLLPEARRTAGHEGGGESGGPTHPPPMGAGGGVSGAGGEGMTPLDQLSDSELPTDDRVIKTFVWHKGECFFVSTIDRASSAIAGPSRYNETLVWRYDWKKTERLAQVHQAEDRQGSIATHQRLVKAIHDFGDKAFVSIDEVLESDRARHRCGNRH